jgi:hypothetical protein
MVRFIVRREDWTGTAFGGRRHHDHRSPAAECHENVMNNRLFFS